MKRNNVDLYTRMMDGYDNSFVMKQLENVLPKQSKLLELGMGTGADLIALSKNYQVTGSDQSPLFVADFKKKSTLPVYVLDAVTMEIKEKFDCIYSNKVLQYLTEEQLKQSLTRQSEHLNKDGILFMTLWHGTPRKESMLDGEYDMFYYDEATIKALLPSDLKLETCLLYEEFEKNDSMIVILKAK